MIKDMFERYFYIPDRNETMTSVDFEIESSLIHRSSIYKDVYGSSDKYTDYQLRPNVCIAMAVAPELFTPQRAKKCM